MSSYSATIEQVCINNAYSKRDSAFVKAEKIRIQEMAICNQLAEEGQYTAMADCRRTAGEKFFESKGMAEEALALDLAACSPVVIP